jgi:hypothetical protein
MYLRFPWSRWVFIVIDDEARTSCANRDVAAVQRLLDGIPL